jgi:hypothetical protein
MSSGMMLSLIIDHSRSFQVGLLATFFHLQFLSYVDSPLNIKPGNWAQTFSGTLSHFENSLADESLYVNMTNRSPTSQDVVTGTVL